MHFHSIIHTGTCINNACLLAWFHQFTCSKEQRGGRKEPSTSSLNLKMETEKGKPQRRLEQERRQQ